MTSEERYAQLLSRSALETALETKKRGVKANFKPAQKKDPCVFDFVQEDNQHDINVIIDEFSRLSNSTREDMMGYSRKLPLANARHVLFCVLHDIVRMSNPQIARIFKRDASTVLHSSERGREIIDENKFLLEHINEILSKARSK
jgi:chromosomal replication initiation ATPase DnaA